MVRAANWSSCGGVMSARGVRGAAALQWSVILGCPVNGGVTVIMN